jgi:DNA polymerase III subunit epsilon
MKLFFFDLETTGTMYWKNGIHQISGIIEIDGEIKESFDFKVQPNPSAQVDEQALKVSGITKETLSNYPPMRDVYTQLVVMLGKYVNKFDKKDKFFLVGYNNASFDNSFLRAFFVQNGDQYFGSWFWSSSIDAMVLASDALMLCRHNMENFKLHTVCKELMIDVDESKLHDAVYDVGLTRKVFKLCTSLKFFPQT